MTELVVYDDIGSYLAPLTDFQDVKRIRDQGQALKLLAERTHDAKLMRIAVNYIGYSQRKMGEMSDGLKKGAGPGRGKTCLTSETSFKHEALKAAGLSRATANRYEHLFRLTPEDFLMVLDRRFNNAMDAALDKGDPFAKQWSGKKEWYTPERYIGLAREVMGGIDLDPASCEAAQKVVQAGRWYGQEDNGLEQDWKGGVFLNPPYKMPEVEKFILRLIAFHACGAVPEAILLVNNATDTGWWHAALGTASAPTASAVCFTLGRISFYDDAGESSSPTNGQCFFYFGGGKKKFAEVFAEVGHTVPFLSIIQ